MNGYEAWIGNCHLRGVGGGADGDPSDGGEYQCQAAVWADNGETFRTRLAAHVEKQGYAILWLEEVLSAANYLARHGNQHKIGPLARAVHAGHPVALSRLTALGATGAPAEPESYLTIEEIEGVEPLDLQAGVHPRKTVPDSLREPLFGQPEPSEAEIARYGSAEAVPPLKTYAILDAAKFQWGLSEIDKCGLPYRCLFKGDAAAELKDVAPYLIELAPEADFTRRLFTHDPDMPDHMTGVHLWHKEPGIYIRSRAGFDALWKHFRKFTQIADENGKMFFFNFWDPPICDGVLRALASDADRLSRWFCANGSILIHCILSVGPITQRYAVKEPADALCNAKPALLMLDEAYRKAFEDMAIQRSVKKIIDAVSTDYPDQLYHSALPPKSDALEKAALAAFDRAQALGLNSELANGQYVAAELIMGVPLEAEFIGRFRHSGKTKRHENQWTKDLLNFSLEERKAVQ